MASKGNLPPGYPFERSRTTQDREARQDALRGNILGDLGVAKSERRDWWRGTLRGPEGIADIAAGSTGGRDQEIRPAPTLRNRGYLDAQIPAVMPGDVDDRLVPVDLLRR